jgi:hypothetical protein
MSKREKPIFEEVFRQLIHQPQFWVKLLIGGGLSFIPLVNIFALGYLYRFSSQLRRTGQIRLPEWNDWQGLFLDGIRFVLVWLAYWILPLILVIIPSFMFFSLGLFIPGYLILSATLLVASILFCSALYRFHMNPDYRTLFNAREIVRMGYVCFEACMLPVLVVAGICAVILPLYGIAFFAGFLLLITQSNLYYRSLELRK